MAALPVHKRRAFKLLVACYFLLFSISPLTYALPAKQAPESKCAAVKKTPALQSVDPSVKASLSYPQSSAETNPHADRNSRVPIKKKRAVTPEDFSEKIALFTAVPVPTGCFCDPSASTIRCLPEKRPDINKGFNPLFAGNSPPSA
jgi:hypothetical protein